MAWAIDQSALTAAADVDVAIDGVAFPSFYGTDRSDVAARLHNVGAGRKCLE